MTQETQGAIYSTQWMWQLQWASTLCFEAELNDNGANRSVTAPRAKATVMSCPSAHHYSPPSKVKAFHQELDYHPGQNKYSYK